MNILYFHGLDGSLNDEKRGVLEQHGKVFGPQIDYRASDHTVNSLIIEYQNKDIDVVIGNSMGGLAAYYVSLIYNTPCLIFNPALPYANILQNMPKNLSAREKYLQVVLGRQDDVINAADNLSFLDDEIPDDLRSTIHILNHAGHQIPIGDFEAELGFFFNVIEGLFQETRV